MPHHLFNVLCLLACASLTFPVSHALAADATPMLPYTPLQRDASTRLERVANQLIEMSRNATPFALRQPPVTPESLLAMTGNPSAALKRFEADHDFGPKMVMISYALAAEAKARLGDRAESDKLFAQSLDASTRVYRTGYIEGADYQPAGAAMIRAGRFDLLPKLIEVVPKEGATPGEHPAALRQQLVLTMLAVGETSRAAEMARSIEPGYYSGTSRINALISAAQQSTGGAAASLYADAILTRSSHPALAEQLNGLVDRIAELKDQAQMERVIAGVTEQVAEDPEAVRRHARERLTALREVASARSLTTAPATTRSSPAAQSSSRTRGGEKRQAMIEALWYGRDEAAHAMIAEAPAAQRGELAEIAAAVSASRRRESSARAYLKLADEARGDAPPALNAKPLELFYGDREWTMYPLLTRARFGDVQVICDLAAARAADLPRQAKGGDDTLMEAYQLGLVLAIAGAGEADLKWAEGLDQASRVHAWTGYAEGLLERASSIPAEARRFDQRQHGWN